MKKLLLLAAFGLLASPAFAQSHTATHTVNGASSSGNDAVIIQGGERQTATVTQEGIDNTVRAVQDRPGFSTNNDNTFVSDQLGERNDINSINAGANQITDVEQVGNDNRVSTESGGVGANLQGIGHDTYIDQVGNENEALVRAGGEYDNDTRITQGDALTGSFSSEARVRYDGQDNTTNIDQFGTDNDAGANMVGDDNTVDIIQTGDRNVADLDGGSWGDYGVNLRGSDNDIDVTQTGEDNTAYVIVGLTGTGNADDLNTISMVQDGTFNDGSVDIRGDENMVDFLQDGNLNTADVVIRGNLNEVDLFQVGGGHTMTATINGQDNMTLVCQNSGACTPTP